MKRNIISAMCLATIVLLAASCSQENEAIAPVANEGLTFKGIAESIGGETRAYNKYSYDVLWNANDKIYVTDNNGHNNTFSLTSGADTPVGTFSEDKDYVGFTSGETVEAFYPASLKTSDGYVWPAVQTNNQVAPMYAKQKLSGTENEAIGFSSLGGLLQIVFSTKAEGFTVTSITLQDNKKPLSGKFTVDENGQAIMEENDENPGVKLDLGESGVPVGVAATYFNLAIPAGTYSTPEKDEEMTITFTDAVHHKECVMTSKTFPEVKRNTVGRIVLAKDIQEQHFTVKFDMNGRNGVAPENMKVAYNTTFEAPTPTATLSIFRGWYKDSQCTIAYNSSEPVTKDMTLYAKWINGINGHPYIEIAGIKIATEYISTKNTDETKFPPVYEADKNPWNTFNEHCCYYDQYTAAAAAQSWGSEVDENGVTYSWDLLSLEQSKIIAAETYPTLTTWYRDPTWKNNEYEVSDKNAPSKKFKIPAAGIYRKGWLGEGINDLYGAGTIGYVWYGMEYYCFGFSDADIYGGITRISRDFQCTIYYGALALPAVQETKP